MTGRGVDPGPQQGLFLRNVAWLMSGTGLAQVIAFAASPVLSRLFTPDEFGVLGLFVATLTMMAVVVAWRYEMAIIVPRNDLGAASVACVALSIVLLMTLSAAVLVALAGGVYSRALGAESLEGVLWLLPLVLLAEGVYQVLNYWWTRRGGYSRLAASRVTRSLGTALAQVGAGLIQAGTTGLVAGRAAGITAGALLLGSSGGREDRRLLLRGLSARRMRAAFHRYRDFHRFGAPQALVNALSQSAPPLLFGIVFEPAAVGFYWFAHRVLQTPMYLVGQSVRQVYYQRATDLLHRGFSLLPSLRKATIGLAAVAILPTILVIAIGPSLFGVVFGEEWVVGGEFARWLVIGLFTTFVNVPSGALVPILELQAHLLVWDILFLVARVSAILGAAAYGGPVSAVAAYSIVGVAFNSLLIGFVYYRAKRDSAPSRGGA